LVLTKLIPGLYLTLTIKSYVMSLITRGLNGRHSFSLLLGVSAAIRIGLILYSEWHDKHSIVKYTDVDYRVFTDAAKFLLQPEEGNLAKGPFLNWTLPVSGMDIGE
jgi:hypothetical protein